eukprot:jgi/Ulvmu1/7399/UM036_0059.1
MEYGALPELLKRALGVPFGSEGGREVRDAASLKYWVAMGCPADISWMDVHIPFGISDDNAPIHLSFGLACKSPRLLPIEEYTALFEKALYDHKYDINAEEHLDRALDTWMLSYINDEKELVQGAAAKRQVRGMIPKMMPLGNTTPDLHQTAEMLVAITKTSIKDWTLEREPEDPAPLITKSYIDAMQAASVHRNVGNATGHGQDQVSIRDSINKMWI